jgi:hypothetical protein
MDRMSNNSDSKHLLKSVQVTPLPIGSGGNNSMKTQMNQTNTLLTMIQAQANANTKYDPPVPQPVTKQVIKETFTSDMGTVPSVLFVLGGLFLVYSMVAK